MLLERRIQLGVLRDLLVASRATSQLVLIGGEAGAGKTALVDEFCALADAAVLVGRCDDLFAPRPLGPLADIARDAGGSLREAIDGGHASAAFDAFLDLLADPTGPRIVVLEDLQWADEATLDLLRFVARRLDRGRSLIVATYRDDLSPEHPLRQTIAGLTGSNVYRLTLPPLSLEAVRALVGERSIDSVALHRATAGNPFYVVEVLAAEHWTIPSSVREAVLTRAARLDRPSRDALDATAVLGSHASAEAVTQVADCPPEALERCVAIGLLDNDGHTLSFRHDLSRAAIEAAITPWRRRGLHARALDALAGCDDLGALAHHAIATGDDAAICEFAPAAAERCTALGANRAAAQLYGSAVAHSAALPELEQIGLHEAHARACGAIGDEETARESAALVLSHLREEGDARRLAAWLSWRASATSCSGQYTAEAKAYSREAVALLTPLGDTPELANALGSVAGQCMLIGPVHETIEYGTRSLELAERFGDEDLALRMLACLGTVKACSDDEHGVEMLRQSLARAEAADHAVGIARAANNLAAALDSLWRPLEALPYVEIAYRTAAANELVYRPAFVRQEQACSELLLGRWDAALATALAVIGDPDLDEPGRTIALTIVAQVRSRRGEPGVATALAEADLLGGAETDVQVIHPLRIAHAEASWFDGDSASASAQLPPLIESHRDWIEPWRLGELAMWCWRVGAEFPIRRPIADPFRLHMAGRFAEAAAVFDERGCPYHTADALGDSSDEGDLRRSLEILHGLGAARRAAQVTARLRRLGVQAIPRGPRATTRTHVAGLTAREAEVAALLANGLTNADIADRLVVSPKTVDHHVTAVLAKLGVPNRRAVAAALDMLGAGDGRVRHGPGHSR